MGTLAASSTLIAQQFGSTANKLARVTNVTSRAGSLISRIYYSTRTPDVLEPGQSGPWRPLQWAQFNIAFSLALMGSDGNYTVYVFDGAKRISHEQRSVVTLNPVQTGSAISDHAYAIPARVTVEILMSDAMQSFVTGQWPGPSKSASAYQTLVDLQKRRKVLQVATRLRDYDKMLITDIHVNDAAATATSLKADVTFTEILTASVEATSDTIKYGASGTVEEMKQLQTIAPTTTGQVSTSPVPSNIKAQNLIDTGTQAAARNVPGAGDWSSVLQGASSLVVH